MKKTLPTAALGFTLAFFSTTAHAALVFNLGGPDFSFDSGGTGTYGGSGADLDDAVLTLTFEQTVSNTVRLTMDTGAMPDGLGKITDVWFNVGSPLSYTDLSFSYVSGVQADRIIEGGNVSSAGIFDINFEFKPAGPLGHFHYGMTSVYDITAPGLTESAFDAFSPEGLAAAFHMNVTGIAEEGGHYATTLPPVPLPSTLILFGTGLAGLALFQKRKKRN